MTKEEEEQFLEQIDKTIIPVAINMTQDQVVNIIEQVKKANPDLPEGFANMLLEKILVAKSKIFTQG